MQKMRAIMKRTIITVVGKDTVGIIAKVCTYLAENGIYYICRTRISVMTLKVLITLYGMIARQYMAGKGNGGSYISDCREVRNTVKKQLRLLSPAYLKRAQKKQLSKTN